MKSISLVLVVLGALVFPWTTQAITEHGVTLVDSSAAIPFTRHSDAFTEGLGGSAWLDFDNDLDLDLFIVNGFGEPNGLFVNFFGSFINFAQFAGVEGRTANGGAVAADIDNDGCVDLFSIGAGGIGGPATLGTPHKLFINNCDGTFTDISIASGIEAPHPAMMAAFGDINNDSFVDLFITNPGSFVSGMGPQALYLNNGDRTFTDISATAGINTSNGGCVVNFSDFDNDGLQDILVGNCNLLNFPVGAAPIPIPGPWELWYNNGDNTFTEGATAAGLNVRPGFPMSLTSADIDGDGDFDLFATGLGVAFGPTYGLLAEQVLFKNNGDGTFSDATALAGLTGYEWGWGASFADFDNDGDEDLLQAGSFPPNFGVIGPPLASPGRLYENDGNGNFTVAQSFGLDERFTSGLAVGDYNADGFVDAVINTAEFEATNLFGIPFAAPGEAVLLTNQGNANHSLTLGLVGTTSNRSAIGAVVRLSQGPDRQVKQVHAGTSFSSGNSPWLTFGLGDQQVANAEIHWPSGLTEVFSNLGAGPQVVLLEEGMGNSSLIFQDGFESGDLSAWSSAVGN